MIGRQRHDCDVVLVAQQRPDTLSDEQIVVRNHCSEGHEFVGDALQRQRFDHAVPAVPGSRARSPT
jgi:hypothetical protein